LGPPAEIAVRGSLKFEVREAAFVARVGIGIGIGIEK
jgi:hypothetical protein